MIHYTIGIDIAEFANLPVHNKLSHTYPILRNKKILLFLGRINWKKGLDILIKACSIVAKNRADIHLLIVGDDDNDYGKRLRQWIKEHHLEAKVTLLGMRTGREKLEIFSGSDIFILPSYSESFGMAVVEAMASGLPIIVSRMVGIYTSILKANAGIVVENDVAQLTEAINYLLNNPQMSQTMGKAGKRYVEEFNLDKAADKTIEMYRTILS